MPFSAHAVLQGPIPIGHLNEFIHELYPYEDETFCQQVMSGFAEGMPFSCLFYAISLVAQGL